MRVTTAAAEKRQAHKTAKGTIVQKYGEIYGNVARRQMKDDDDDVKEVVNMRENLYRSHGLSSTKI